MGRCSHLPLKIMIDKIINKYPEETFIKLDGFDEAIIGVEELNMRLIYSVLECIKILCREMNEEDAYDYFYYNIAGGYIGEKTPILCDDDFQYG